MEVTPGLGAGFFLADVSDPFETDDGTQFRVSIDDAFALALTIGWRLTKRVTIEAGVATVPSQIAARGGGVSVGFDTDVTLLGGSIVYNFRGEAARGWPFLVGGAGMVAYSGAFGTERDPMWSIGGGYRLDLSGLLGFRFELRDYMSSFEAVPEGEEPRFQNDVLITVGLVFSLL